MEANTGESQPNTSELKYAWWKTENLLLKLFNGKTNEEKSKCHRKVASIREQNNGNWWVRSVGKSRTRKLDTGRKKRQDEEDGEVD